MLIKDQLIEIKWQNGNKKHYIDLGYPFTNKGDSFVVPIDHLTRGSRVDVKVQCDYCGEVFLRENKLYNTLLDNSLNKKDSCPDCSRKKYKETNFLKHGYENPMQNPIFIKKRSETSLEKYGYEHHMQNEEFKENFFNSNIEKLGVRYPAQNPNVIKKRDETNLDRYGVKSILELEEVHKKGLEKLKTLKKDKTSKQQRFISSLLPKNEINLQVGKYLLDIAFPSEKIFIEYDGSGHNLSVKLNRITQDEFKKKEKDRFNFLYLNGWREIRLVSTNDMLPDEDYLKSRIISEIDRLKENKYLKRITIYLNKIENINFHRVKGEI